VSCCRLMASPMCCLQHRSKRTLTGRGIGRAEQAKLAQWSHQSETSHHAATSCAKNRRFMVLALSYHSEQLVEFF
jgi:hypothetical protein